MITQQTERNIVRRDRERNSGAKRWAPGSSTCIARGRVTRYIAASRNDIRATLTDRLTSWTDAKVELNVDAVESACRGSRARSRTSGYRHAAAERFAEIRIIL